MYKYFLWSAVACLIGRAVPINALAWERTYGGTEDDVSWAVQQTSDEGYIIAGETCSYGAGSGDVYLIKTNSLGDTVWTRTYGGTSRDYGKSVRQTSDSGYIIVGCTWSYGPGSEDVWLIKTDSSGDTLWTKTYGGTFPDRGNSVQQTSDSGYIIAGVTQSYGVGGVDVWLIKINLAGDTLWTKTYGGADNDYAKSVQQTDDGGYIIAGYTYSFGAGECDVYLIKTDSSGSPEWTRTYGGIYWDDGQSVQQTSDGGYIIAGGIDLSPSVPDVWLIKTDSSGDTLWTRTYGETGESDGGQSVQETSDGGYIIAGFTNSYGAGLEDVYLIKTDSSGDTIWTRTYGGTSHDYARSVQQTSDGGYIIAGTTQSYGAGLCDVYLIKTDSLGLSGIEERENPNDELRMMKLQVYPNPSFGGVVVKYGLPEKASITLSLYDISGRLMKTIYSGTQQKGEYEVEMNGEHLGSPLPTGVYFIKLEVPMPCQGGVASSTGEFRATRKLTILR